MKRKFWILLPIMLAVLTIGYAADCCQTQQPVCPCPDADREQGHIKCQDKMTPGYNHPARYDVKGCWDFYATASFIYWEPREKGIEVDFLQPTNPNLNAGAVQNMAFEYKPGFKVGIGINFDHDNWDSYLEYTRLHMSVSKSVTIPTWSDQLTHNWFYLWPNTDVISGKWTLNMDVLDYELGRPEYIGTKLTFKPFIGLKGGWIDQSYVAQRTYQQISYYNRLKSKSWLIGPRAGLDTKWLLGGGFRVYSDMAASLVYQYFRSISMKIDSNLDNTSLVYHQTNKIGYVTPVFELGLGLGWGSYSICNKYHLDMSLGYDFQYLWNQNMIRDLKDTTFAITGASPGDLMLHGLTITARFDF